MPGIDDRLGAAAVCSVVADSSVAAGTGATAEGEFHALFHVCPKIAH